jgi:hypothetical protein
VRERPISRRAAPVRLLCIDASFQQNLNDQEKVVWIQTLADVVNLKLEQATQGRSELRKFSVANESFSTPYLHLRPGTWQLPIGNPPRALVERHLIGRGRAKFYGHRCALRSRVMSAAYLTN